jgi:hypothetical protein
VFERYLRYKDAADRYGLLVFDCKPDDDHYPAEMQRLDPAKVDARDIIEYGIKLQIRAFDEFAIAKILTNLVEREPDRHERQTKLIEKECVLSLISGDTIDCCVATLNSYTTLSLSDTVKALGVEKECELLIDLMTNVQCRED